MSAAFVGLVITKSYFEIESKLPAVKLCNPAHVCCTINMALLCKGCARILLIIKLKSFANKIIYFQGQIVLFV